MILEDIQVSLHEDCIRYKVFFFFFNGFQSDKDSLNINHTSLGKVKIPVNPNWNQSSLDGTQCSRSSSPCPATIISSEGFSFKPIDCSQSYSLHLSVTCHLSQSLSNGNSAVEGSHSGVSCLSQQHLLASLEDFKFVNKIGH